LQLIPDVAEAFLQERITASHENLIARIPQESEGVAFEQFVFQPRTLADIGLSSDEPVSNSPGLYPSHDETFW
jgi:hypothetical protein